MPTLNFQQNSYGNYWMKTSKGSMITVGKTKHDYWYWMIKSPKELAETNDYNYTPKVIGKDTNNLGQIIEEPIPDGFSRYEYAMDDLCMALDRVYGGTYKWDIEEEEENE